ncbi:MAG: transglutaminase domain-containing protein [Pseudomonadota bacterium]
MNKKPNHLYYRLICLFAVLFSHAGFASESGYTVTRQVQYGFTLKNTANRLLKGAEFRTYAPVKETATQRCEQITASHPYDLVEDNFGNQILCFKVDDLPPYAVKIITIRATLRLAETPNPTKVPDLKAFLKPERYIESDDSELLRLAKDLKRSLPVETAKSIFTWVADNVTYSGYMSDDRGALYAFKNRRGDCTESMYLFTALCRANEIPARGIGGYICSENSTLRSNAYHNWAEFYDDGAWKIADPQKKSFMEKPSRYIAMRIIGTPAGNQIGEFHRFRFSGEGLDVRMND